MKKNMTLSRRGFLKGAAVASGAAVGSRIISPFERDARAADPERAAVVVLHLNGGFNSLFNSADSFLAAGTFGVTANRVMMLGGDGGLAVDAQTLGTLPTFARTHMATIGVRHGISDHGVAQGQQPLPADFSVDVKQLWRTTLSPGHSSPCVCGDLIVLTTFQADEKELATVCLYRATGVVRWNQVVPT